MAIPKILVVEDEVIVARDIMAQLEQLGYPPIGHAASGNCQDEKTRLFWR